MNFYISDTHFGHKNILSFDCRPYFSVLDMDSSMVENWNSVVNNDDIVYVLGDFSWYDNVMEDSILDKLNGRKVLITGNHDKNLGSTKWYKVANYLEVDDGDDKVVLCHYPIFPFHGMEHGWYHLYGHVHNASDSKMVEYQKQAYKELRRLPCNMANVGCMMPYMDYTPRTLKEIKEKAFSEI